MAHHIETARRTSSGGSRLAIINDADDRVLARLAIETDDDGNVTINVINNAGGILVRPVSSNDVILRTDSVWA